MAGKGRRSYLEDFQKDVNGEYHYHGAHWRYTGARPYPELRRELWLCVGGSAVLLLAAGCLPGATAGAAWYVTLPYMTALILAGVLAWTLGRWTKGGMTLRAYVHAQTVKRLPGLALSAAIAAALGTAGQGISLLLQNSVNWGKIALFCFLLVAMALEVRAFVLVKRTENDFTEVDR